MPAVIPTEIKNDVIQSWFCGLSRRSNAIKHRVSEGSVDNFVKGWKLQHGPEGEYERLRALSVAISKTGLSVQGCADGHRVAMIMRNMGVAEEDYESFISKLWKGYVESGLSPDILVEQINRLHFFLENNQKNVGITTTLSQILETIKSKLDEIKDLDSKEQNLEKMNRELHTQQETVEAELNWDSQLKEKLNKNGFKKEDVPRFVDAALLMKERDYDIFEIVEQFSKFEKIAEACASIELKEVNAGLRHDQLLTENQALEVSISQNSLKLRDLDTLKALGFGLSEFRMLRDIITEVAEERGIIGNDAVKIFFEDLQSHYYEYVRLRRSVSELKAEEAKLSAKDTANSITNMLHDYLKSYSKSFVESNSKYKPNTPDDISEKKVMPDENNYNNVASAKGPNGGPLDDSTLEPPHSDEELREGDDLCKISYEEQEIREDQVLFRKEELSQENLSTKLEVKLDSALQNGSKKMKINNDLVVPHVQKDRSRLRPRLAPSPKSYQLKRSTRSNSISSGHIPNTKSDRKSKPDELRLTMGHIQDGIFGTIRRSMSRDPAEELTKSGNWQESIT